VRCPLKGDGVSYQQRRVYVSEFSVLPGDSPLLVPIPTAPGHKQQYIHKAVLPDFMAMSDAVNHDLGSPILVASGWRPPLWATKEAYEADMVRQYGSVAKGRTYRAFQSSHSTGLSFDCGSGGLAPVSKTIPKQKKTKLYNWIVQNAYRWNWHPFFPEPWHLENWIDQESYKSGVITKSCIYTPPSSPIQTNDVCEDGSCFTTPLLDDGSSLVCK
jgi:hypothetical protein